MRAFLAAQWLISFELCGGQLALVRQDSVCEGTGIIWEFCCEENCLQVHYCLY